LNFLIILSLETIRLHQKQLLPVDVAVLDRHGRKIKIGFADLRFELDAPVLGDGVNEPEQIRKNGCLKPLNSCQFLIFAIL
jgi:hypothetical protein